MKGIKKVLIFSSLMLLIMNSGYAVETFPAQSGFPKTEVRGIEFASPSVVDINGNNQLDVLIADIKTLFFSDKEFNIMERNMLRFLEKLLKN